MPHLGRSLVKLVVFCLISILMLNLITERTQLQFWTHFSTEFSSTTRCDNCPVEGHDRITYKISNANELSVTTVIKNSYIDALISEKEKSLSTKGVSES